LLTVGEVAELLETAEDDVMNLVERGGIPFHVVAGLNRSNPDTYRFGLRGRLYGLPERR
jgi:excisionase family DNA binding protein